MKRFTITSVAIAALSTAALAQVGTDPVENKIPGNQLPADSGPPATDATPTTDDAPPSARADAPAATPSNVTQSPGDPTNASGPPPKR